MCWSRSTEEKDLRSKWTWIWPIVWILSCESPANLLLDGVEPYDALPQYTEFWAATSACSGRSGDLGLIRWFRAVSIVSQGQIVRGLWQPPHRITVWTGLEDDAGTVRHEMLHDLLGGDPDHNRRGWADCGLLPS